MDYSFGESIKTYREKKKLSIRFLAQRVGISAAYLSDIENGKRAAPSQKVFCRLVKELNLSMSEIKDLEKMALYSNMNKVRILKDYLNKNPSAFKFILLAIENNVSNDIWDKMCKDLAIYFNKDF